LKDSARWQGQGHKQEPFHLVISLSLDYNVEEDMAQANDPNQTIDQQKDSAKESAVASGTSSPDAEALSLENLDSLILAEDPSFAEDLSEVSALPVDGSLDLDVVELGDNLTPPEKMNPWRHPIGLRKLLVKVFPFLPVLWDVQHKLLGRAGLSRTHFKDFLLHLGPNILHGTKNAASSTGAFIKGRISAFGGLSRGLKLIAIGLLLLSGATAAFIYRSYTHGVLPEDKELIMASLEEWSAHSYKYDADSEMDSFYDSPRTIQNIMSLPKMIVNIRPSASSGANPMAAMEFFLEGLSPEANIEVKDRESEIRDLFQRTMEEMSFDELDSGEGKQLLTERLRQSLNNVLSKGQIRRVYIKEAVIKP
jgi:flagellar basal body-associated protein FliL